MGRSAPDFTLPTLSGKPVSLGSLRGKVVILDFFATWCGPCRASMPGVENLAKQYSGQGVELIALNQGESATKVRSFLSSVGISPRVALDAQAGVGERYGVSGIPHLVMIDRQGIVRVAQSGLPQDSKRYLEPHLQKLLAQ